MISKNFGKNHEVIVIKRDKEILLCTSSGKEIASIYLDTMTDKDEKQTENFFVTFLPAEKSPLDKNIATVIL